MLGLEENMSESNVIDIRFDRFLRELRETGCFEISAKKSGMTISEVEARCKQNPKFDLAAIECHLEFLEEKLDQQKRDGLKKAREVHMRAYNIRHPEAKTDG